MDAIRKEIEEGATRAYMTDLNIFRRGNDEIDEDDGRNDRGNEEWPDPRGKMILRSVNRRI